MIKKIHLFLLLLLFAFSGIYINANSLIPESTVSLAQKYNMDAEELHSLLKSSEENRTLELVPLTKDDSSFYVDLFSNPSNSDHMKYYGSGKLLTEKQAKRVFNGRISRMWDYEKPRSLAFILKHNDTPAGFIGVGPLSSDKFSPEIGHVIEKDHSNKGLGTFCVKTIVKLMQRLKDLGIYSYKSTIATAKEDNIASKKTFTKSGFTENEKTIKTQYGIEKKFEYNFS